MKMNKNFLVGIGFSLTSFMPGYISAQDNAVKDYVECHLEKIIKSQEDKLGIKHFGIPKIKYEPAPWIKGQFRIACTYGSYDQEKDLIYINLGLQKPDTLKKLEDFQIEDLKSTLNHELGHYYSDKLHESFGLGNYPCPKGEQEFVDGLRVKLISEGIAEYFERVASNKFFSTDENYLLTSQNDFFVDVHLSYEAGFNLVKPILDKYGKEGIKYLILNPPEVKDIGNLKDYQKRVMDGLSKDYQ